MRRRSRSLEMELLVQNAFVFTDEQLRRGGVRRAERVRMRRNGELTAHLVPKLSELELAEPVYDSAVDGVLNASAIETKLRRRFEGVRSYSTVAHSVRREVSEAHKQHEVLLTDVFLRCRELYPELEWFPESAIAATFGARGEDVSIPDGALVAHGEIVTFVDFCSSYRSPRLRELVTWSEAHGAPIQFW